MSKAPDVKRLFEETNKVLGSPNVLVNNTGVFRFEYFEAITEEEFHREFDINVLGQILTIQQALKHFPASGVSPFHNPVRLAEDAAVVDVISGGRFELGVGAGFKLEEFDSFGVAFKERGARTSQSLEIIRRALSSETVTFKSDFFDFKNVKVTPTPIQRPHPPIWLVGFTLAALRRAVRYGDGFTQPGASREATMRMSPS